jgi:anti-anti-sigma factor
MFDAGGSDGARVGWDRGEVVVWLDGDHDIATMRGVNAALVRAISLDDGDVIVDLSGVTFIAVATVRILIETRDFLRGQSRDLLLRSPSKTATRVLNLCAPDATTDSGLAAYG